MTRARLGNMAVPILFLVIGVVSIMDGIRINDTVRLPGVFDILGPDRYIIVVGALLILCGVGLAASELRKSAVEPAEQADGEESAKATTATAVIFVLLSLYALLMPVTGYLLGTGLFLALAFPLMGVRGWVPWAVATVLSALIFHVLFQGFADMPLPAGPLPSPFGY